MKIYIGNDHTGVDLKNAIVQHLEEVGHKVKNLGTDEKVSSNYAVYGENVGLAVAKDPGSFGIVICGTGIGISIAANKVKGVVCALVYDPENATITRQHNDANMMATGARLVSVQRAINCVDAFLDATFEGGRHTERVSYLKNMEGAK